jgi:hypothetical protein
MRQCPRCSGFVPLNRCPHCGVALRPWLWKVAALLGSSAAAMTLMACYGSPCVGGQCYEPQDDLSAAPVDMSPPIDDGGTTD